MKLGIRRKLRRLKRRSFKLFLQAREKLRRRFALCLGVALGLFSLLIVSSVVLLLQDRPATEETTKATENTEFTQNIETTETTETTENEAISATGEQEEGRDPLPGENEALFTAEQQYWQELAEMIQANSRKWNIKLNPLGEISYIETGKWLQASSWEHRRMKRKTLREAPFYEEKTIGGRIKEWFQGIFISVADQAEILKDRRQDAKTLLTLEEAIPNAWPVKGARISSRFGWRRNPFTKRGSEFHSGLDLAVSSGTKVRAAGGGVVIYAGYKPTWGNMIRISHGHGYVSQYAHNSMLLVKKGDRVERGQIIATVGRTGRATGPHLHFGVSKDGKWIDPLILLSAYK